MKTLSIIAAGALTLGTAASAQGVPAGAVQLAQNTQGQGNQPGHQGHGNHGNQQPPAQGHPDGRPQVPEQLCSEVQNPQPGRNCSENPEHFRPVARPPQ
ncbi:hypothetical protein [uncultured Parasphingopyxis sp.]|mgnify:CR=1 FL=1|uniref:hypothetical protein n=1 Tax=uncultured Parasphingopyxis sp. TaxID=1547918 RepID=UPI00260ED98F|nr:hypothetical protein [uncultured Parasphingopyxis sp.]